jgi:hypothetical protein
VRSDAAGSSAGTSAGGSGGSEAAAADAGSSVGSSVGLADSSAIVTSHVTSHVRSGAASSSGERGERNIEDVFTDSTAFAKSPHAMRHQEIFALRPSMDGMMDVLRKAFLANVDDIYSLADALATDNQLTVRVKENSKRGCARCVSERRERQQQRAESARQ